MDMLNIVPAARVHLRSKEDVIMFVVAIVVYFAVNLLLQKFKPDMQQKKINIISLVIGIAAMVVCMFILL